MGITYFATALNTVVPGTPSTNYPGKPIGLGIAPTPVIPLTLPDLVLCSLFDLAHGVPLPTPINVSWLYDLFESVLDDLPPAMRMQKFDSISPSWKRNFSETVAGAVSIAVALFQEHYSWVLPIALLKKPHAGILNPPVTWFAAPLSSGIMPDFLIARSTPRGLFELSTLESKGLDRRIDSKTFSEFTVLKQQAENVFLPPSPPYLFGGWISRRILSTVAIRPQLATPALREVQCRWFNHADAAPPPTPGTLGYIAAMQIRLALERLFGIRLDFRNGPTVGLERLHAQINQRLQLTLDAGDYYLPTRIGDQLPWRPYISRRCIQLFIELIWNTALRPEERDALVNSALVSIDIRHEPMLPIGIGLKNIG